MELSKKLPFSSEEIVKDTGVKISKRKSTHSVLPFDDVLNDINDWLAEENGENDEIGDNRDELCGEEEEIDSNPSEECLEEEQQFKEPDMMQMDIKDTGQENNSLAVETFTILTVH